MLQGPHPTGKSSEFWARWPGTTHYAFCVWLRVISARLLNCIKSFSHSEVELDDETECDLLHQEDECEDSDSAEG